MAGCFARYWHKLIFCLFESEIKHVFAHIRLLVCKLPGKCGLTSSRLRPYAVQSRKKRLNAVHVCESCFFVFVCTVECHVSRETAPCEIVVSGRICKGVRGCVSCLCLWRLDILRWCCGLCRLNVLRWCCSLWRLDILRWCCSLCRLSVLCWCCLCRLNILRWCCGLCRLVCFCRHTNLWRGILWIGILCYRILRRGILCCCGCLQRRWERARNTFSCFYITHMSILLSCNKSVFLCCFLYARPALVGGSRLLYHIWGWKKGETQCSAAPFIYPSSFFLFIHFVCSSKK